MGDVRAYQRPSQLGFTPSLQTAPNTGRKPPSINRSNPRRSNPVQTSRDYDDVITFEALKELYDECSIETFDTYHRLFYGINWTVAFIIIVSSSLSGLAQTPQLSSTGTEMNNETLSLISVISGLFAAILTAMDRIISFQKIGDDCKTARTELAYYLSNRYDMPKRIFDKISNTGLLCLKHPLRCAPIDV